ncbi:MAG: TraU family protein, partial [Rhodospirillales bacterium]|nr:TraU family protein [Rhodospirillales bacterium]
MFIALIASGLVVPGVIPLLGAALLPGAAHAQACTGRFVNPLTDVCWECLFPISIGAVSIGAAAGAPDTPN